MQSRFGTDFSNVKIHTGDDAVNMSMEMNAQAFTLGSDIFFNSGNYNPYSNDGKYLLAHELTHTLQQSAGSTIKRVPDRPVVPEIDNPYEVATWQSPGDELFQWQNETLLSSSYPERAKGLRSFLMLVKELELRGHLGTSAVASREVNPGLRTFLQELNKFDEKELAEKVAAVFERYKGIETFPEWVQEVVMNYSGMKYKSAHGSYYDPVSMLAIIKKNELDTAEADEKEAMVAEAVEMMASGDGLDLLKPRERRSLQSKFKESSLSTLSKQIPVKEKEAYNVPSSKQNELWELYSQFNQTAIGSQAFSDLQAEILKKEAEIIFMEKQFGKVTWRRIMNKRSAQIEALLNLFRAIAMQKVKMLREGQALQLLSLMYDEGEIPEEAWKEIVGHTGLRLQVTSSDEMVTTRRALKNVKPDAAISGSLG